MLKSLTLSTAAIALSAGLAAHAQVSTETESDMTAKGVIQEPGLPETPDLPPEDVSEAPPEAYEVPEVPTPDVDVDVETSTTVDEDAMIYDDDADPDPLISPETSGEIEPDSDGILDEEPELEMDLDAAVDASEGDLDAMDPVEDVNRATESKLEQLEETGDEVDELIEDTNPGMDLGTSVDTTLEVDPLDID